MAGRIIKSAVLQNGRLWVGLRHGEIIQRMHREGCPKVFQAMQGFVDEDGEFLTREQAYERAVQQGLIVRDGTTPKLRSEMIWADNEKE